MSASHVEVPPGWKDSEYLQDVEKHAEARHGVDDCADSSVHRHESVQQIEQHPDDDENDEKGNHGRFLGRPDGVSDWWERYLTGDPSVVENFA